MVFLGPLMKTACMLYVPLPSLLAVESLVFYLPSVPSCFHQFHHIFIRDFYAGDPCKLCGDRLALFHLCLFIFKYIYLHIPVYHFIDILCFPCFFLFRYCLIFLFDQRRTSLFIADDVIPSVGFADFQYFFTHIKSVSHYTDRKSRETLFYLLRKPYKCFPLAVLLDFFFRQLFLIVFR